MLRSPGKKVHPDGASSQNVSDDQNVNVSRRKHTHTPEWSLAINALSEEFKSTLDEWRHELICSINKISDNVVSIKNELATLTQVTTDIKNDIHSLRTEQSILKQRMAESDCKYVGITQEISEIKNSIQFSAAEQSDFSTKLSEHEKQIRAMSDSQHIITELTSKIDYLEQSARNCNIELCNIPERRNEDLISLMLQIGSSIKCNIKQSDIVEIHRVPHALDNNKPKNIIVKVTSRILRNNILSAHRLHKGLTAQDCGISGTSVPIYMHEHLTLKNKKLFRECREAVKKHNYRFLWVKNGTILVRETEGSKSFAIRSHQDISKIKPSTYAVNSNAIPEIEC